MEVTTTRRRGVWPGTYAEYTATPQWRRIAAQARKDWNYQCAICGRHDRPVEIHHRTYRNVPFGEDFWDTIALCEYCHALFHDRLPKPIRGLFDEIIGDIDVGDVGKRA